MMRALPTNRLVGSILSTRAEFAFGATDYLTGPLKSATWKEVLRGDSGNVSSKESDDIDGPRAVANWQASDGPHLVLGIEAYPSSWQLQRI